MPPDTATDPAPTSMEAGRLTRWVTPATVLGLAISLAVHLFALAIAALIVVGGAQAGGAGAADSGGGPVEVAVLTESELAQISGGAIDAEAPAVPEAPSVSDAALSSLDTSVGGLAETGLELSVDGGVGASGISLGGAGDISASAGLGVGGAGGGAASFFGAEARGTRFAYIVDVSGSMAYDSKIESLKGELLKSIFALQENAEFIIIPFSSDAQPLGGKREWTEADEPGKAWARKGISALIADGGTVPAPAFAVVFSVRPRPDAIYFMTDGQFDESLTLDLLRMNAELKIPIHCITFVNKEAEAMMRRIAQDSGGTYTHVPGKAP
ncbi:MAG: hypothetical protein IT437_09905 [Phycisphaerales bacterium]|nr:hypothetical protein [Phycisphaerales bacterium]